MCAVRNGAKQTKKDTDFQTRNGKKETKKETKKTTKNTTADRGRVSGVKRL
jgi:hypothetical protein